MHRPPHFVLDKIVRISSWPLLLLLLLFFATGYIMSGDFGLGGIIDVKQALAIHRALHLPTVVVLLVHVMPATYLAFRRWIRKPDKM
jgi:Ni,Fe-hydrogenase I cytochrome b subunit